MTLAFFEHGSDLGKWNGLIILRYLPIEEGKTDKFTPLVLSVDSFSSTKRMTETLSWGCEALERAIVLAPEGSTRKGVWQSGFSDLLKALWPPPS